MRPSSFSLPVTFVRIPVVLTLLTALLCACTPALDWREVRFEGEMLASQAKPLIALLPCKPDRATRPQTVGGAQVSLSMMGCQAAGATYALSRMVTPASAADKVLQAWQTASAPTLSAQPTAFTVQGASPWPQAGRVKTAQQGGKSGERGSERHVAWFAQAAGQDVVLYQAAIYAAPDGTPLKAEAIDTFFESLRLQ